MIKTETRSEKTRLLPEEWRLVKLGDVCAQNRIIVEPRSELAVKLPYLSLEHVEPNTGRILREPTEPMEDEGISTTFAFDNRHILYGKLRPYLNKVALPDFQGRCTTEIIPLLPRAEANRVFLCWLLRRAETVEAAMRGKTGSRMPRANVDALMKLEVPLPPIFEQKRIADALEKMMAAVEKARVAAQVRFEAAMKLPAAFLRQVFTSSEATGWATSRLGDVLIPYKEMIHPGDRQNGTAEFVGLEHLEPHTGRRSGSLTLDLTKLTGRKPEFRKGQILYGYLRPYLNKVWVAEFDGCSSVDQYAYDVRSGIADVRFVAWFMRSSTYLSRSEIVTTTGQLPRIGTEEIAAVEIGLPSVDRQVEIVDGIERRFAVQQKLCDSIRAEIEAINALPAALMRRAFNGEI